MMGSVSKYIQLFSLFLLIYIPASTFGANLTWVTADKFLPATQEAAGVREGKKYFIGRMAWEQGVVLGNYVPVDGNFYFTHKGKQQGVKQRNVNLQVLTYPSGAVTWVRKEHGDGRLPRNILLGGIHPETNEHLFVCRARHEHVLIPGQMQIDEDLCVVNWYGEEYKKEKYELLAISLYGMIRRVTV